MYFGYIKMILSCNNLLSSIEFGSFQLAQMSPLIESESSNDIDWPCGTTNQRQLVNCVMSLNEIK